MKSVFFSGCATIILFIGDALERHIESARLYGNIDAYAYYFVDLLVGTPPQRVSVILDTGSALTAFPCSGCPHCGKHMDRNFVAGKSSTFKWMPCESCFESDLPSEALSCKLDHCSYYQGYQEGSSISGYWFRDLVSLGDGIQKNPPIIAPMGCHQDENKLFFTQRANGILGVKGSRNFLQHLFADHNNVESNIFSMCLAEWGGRLTVGGHNTSYHKSMIQYVPIFGSSYYGVDITSMVVNGQTITGFKGAVIDSGTTYTYMGTAPYQALRKAIESACDGKPCGVRNGECYSVSSLTGDALRNFPNVEVRFGSVASFWEPRAYLFRKGGTNSFCYAFQDDGLGASTVLGLSWMLYKEVIFDLNSRRIGLAQADCPEYKKRPRIHSSRSIEDYSVGQLPKESHSAMSRMRTIATFVIVLGVVTMVGCLARVIGSRRTFSHGRSDQEVVNLVETLPMDKSSTELVPRPIESH